MGLMSHVSCMRDVVCFEFCLLAVAFASLPLLGGVLLSPGFHPVCLCISAFVYLLKTYVDVAAVVWVAAVEYIYMMAIRHTRHTHTYTTTTRHARYLCETTCFTFK